MSAFFRSSRIFWSVSLVAAAIVLFTSVQLGKVVGATILASGAHARQAAPHVAPPKGTPEVVGGQIHAAAALGDPTAIWAPGRAPQPAASPSPSASPSASPTASPSASASPSATASPRATPTGGPFTPNPTIAPSSQEPANDQG